MTTRAFMIGFGCGWLILALLCLLPGKQHFLFFVGIGLYHIAVQLLGWWLSERASKAR